VPLINLASKQVTDYLVYLTSPDECSIGLLLENKNKDGFSLTLNKSFFELKRSLFETTLRFTYPASKLPNKLLAKS